MIRPDKGIGWEDSASNGFAETLAKQEAIVKRKNTGKVKVEDEKEHNFEGKMNYYNNHAKELYFSMTIAMTDMKC